MNELVAAPSAKAASAVVASDASLDALPAAAAVLDGQLNLLRANARLLALCPWARPGLPIGELLPPASLQPFVLPEGGELAYRARDLGGRPFEVMLARRGADVGALVLPASGSSVADLMAVSVGGDPWGQVALVALSREIALAGSEEEMVAAISRCVRKLFPGAKFCVRIVDPRTLELTSLYAEGRMLEGERDRLALRREAGDKLRLDWRGLAADRLTVVAEEPRVFAGTVAGLAMPLVAAGQFFGIVNLEYPVPLEAEAARAEPQLVQLANQAAIGVRNAKLIEELGFMRRYHEDLLENANALIFVVDRDRRLVLFNKALVQLTGRKREEVIGTDLFQLVPEPRADGMREILDRSLGGERVTGREVLLLNNDGGEVRISLSTGAVLSGEGQVEGVIGIGQDITLQKELERRIVQAEKLASLGHIASGVVHEINNPLTTITMYSEALLRLPVARTSEASEVDKLKRIHESAERILSFTRDLASYAKPAQDKAQMLDPSGVIDQAVRYCDHVIKQSKATLRRDAPEKLPQILGVRSNLVQIFVNLITNACHALPSEGGRIELTIRERGEGVAIEIADNGTGIDARVLSRIFEPFFTTKSEGRGMGMGLAIVQGIVEKHGGTIQATSVKGKGTTFVVWLPRTFQLL